MHGTISVTNLDKYQHYKKDSKPVWIKLYLSILSDPDMMRLPVSTRYLAIGLTMMAAESGNHIDADPEWLAWRLKLDGPPDVDNLVRIGFITVTEPSRKIIDKSYKDSRPEKRREREEEEFGSSLRSEPAAPGVENSPDRVWHNRLAPIARQIDPHAVSNWLAWAKERDAEACERWMRGFLELRERGFLQWIPPGTPAKPAVMETRLNGEAMWSMCESAYWRYAEGVSS